MISVIIYGRNDPYGYNLHKRAVISLNAIAATLNHAGDEILFVDYNTPDDHPTFIEAIGDMLSPECRRMLRVIRVRPEFHEKYFKGRTHLNALEPISRNIAIRRSNPDNRWILSTNTDMIFVPLDQQKSLSDICADLPSALYELPRFEIPESLWESMDRKDGPGLIRQMREWGDALHMHEVVTCYREIIYDGPGDFQLMPRDDIFKINGFEEGMILGWHVDSNLCKRFYFLYGKNSSLIDHVHAYHCDHTRVASSAHKPNHPENNWRRFVTNLVRADIPEQAESWGYPDIEFEEFRPDESPTQLYAQVMKSVLKKDKTGYYENDYTYKTHDKISYQPEHVLPHIATLLAPLQRNLACGYCGKGPEMYGLFAHVWKQYGFTGKIMIADPGGADLAPLQAIGKSVLGYEPAIVSIDVADAAAGLLIFDIDNLGTDEFEARIDIESWKRRVVFAFSRIARKERQGLKKGVNRRRKYILINAINTEAEAYAYKYLAATHTPFGTHVRHGYVVPAEEMR